jgi:uncharacterized integral membrane protein
MTEEELTEEEQQTRIRHTIIVSIVLFIVSLVFLWNKTTGTFEYRLGATLAQTGLIVIVGTAGFYSAYKPKKPKER